MVRGRVRINAKNFEQSYIPGGKRFLRDIYVTSLQDRNRALEGDIVRRKGSFSISSAIFDMCVPFPPSPACRLLIACGV